MIGSIIGDSVGSIYEFENIKTKDFEFFGLGIEPTDDSILTFATADWIMRGGEVWKYYVAYASKYDCPVGGYGGGDKCAPNADCLAKLHFRLSSISESD